MKFKLQEFRKSAGFNSANDFADHIGMSRGTYTNYEQGKTKLTLEKAWQFADIFGCSLDELAGRPWPTEVVTLTSDETELVDTYRDLDPERRGRLLSTAQDLGLAKSLQSAALPDARTA